MAATTMAVLKRVTEDTPRPIPEIIPEVPAWICELIGHLHAKNPEKRYGTAREVSELLAECAKELEAGRVPQIPDPSTTAKEGAHDSQDARNRGIRQVGQAVEHSRDSHTAEQVSRFQTVCEIW